MDRKSLERAKSASSKLAEALRETPGVMGVGVGVNDDRDDLAITVLVSDEADVDALPEEVDGVEVRLTPSGPVEALSSASK